MTISQGRCPITKIEIEAKANAALQEWCDIWGVNDDHDDKIRPEFITFLVNFAYSIWELSEKDETGAYRR